MAHVTVPVTDGSSTYWCNRTLTITANFAGSPSNSSSLWLTWTPAISSWIPSAMLRKILMKTSASGLIHFLPPPCEKGSPLVKVSKRNQKQTRASVIIHLLNIDSCTWEVKAWGKLWEHLDPGSPTKLSDSVSLFLGSASFYMTTLLLWKLFYVPGKRNAVSLSSLSP